MRLLGHIVFIPCLFVVVECTDITCGPINTWKKVILDLGDSYSFSTQAGDQYGQDVKCTAVYQRASTSSCQLKFSCDSFDITNSKQWCRWREDFMRINDQRYCQTTGPEVTTDSTELRIKFKSSLGGSGAQCRIQCLGLEPTAPPTTTTTPTTTTENPGDVTCGPIWSWRKVILDVGDSYKFSTQTGDQYGQDVRCTAVYERASTSSCQLKFSCDTFDITNSRPWCYYYDDFLRVDDKKYCQTTGPQVTTENTQLRVWFKSSLGGSGAQCRIQCLGLEPTIPTTTITTPSSTTPTLTSTSSSGTTAGSGSTVAPGPTVPNPGGAGSRFQLTIEQTWPQEPTGYTRTAEVVVPTTTAGQKLPVVIFLHGNGGQGNTQPLEKVFTEDNVVIVCPSGYERSWNVYTEKSKADDVSFILDLITKIGTDIPAADMNDVNIIGSSNGAALTYRLMIETGLDRPFHRAFPMVSSLIGPQYNTDTFWKANYGETNVYDIAVVPQFSSNFVYAHFHGTNDGAINYEGQNPGPMFLGQAEVLSAQRTDYLFAKAMGYTGNQIEDSAGVMDGSDVQVYTYLGGRVRHFKIIDGTHGNSGIGNNNVAAVVKEAIVGSK